MKRTLGRVALTLALVLLGVALALCASGGLYAPDLSIPNGFRGQHVKVAGLSLRVLSEGAGRDILMIHGSPGSLEDFAPQASELSKSFRVTRYDRPGHGFSSMGESTSFAYNAKVAAALLDELKLERTIVVGHSYGGSTALALAFLRSPRVSAYVVIDSAVYKHVRPVPAVYHLTSLPLLGLGFLRMIPRDRVQANITSKLPAEFLAGPPPAGFVALRAKLWSEPKIAHTLAIESVHSVTELHQQSERYPEIHAPVYFLSQKDSAPRRENAERFKAAVKQTELELVPKSGHYIQFERPELVTETIRRAAREH